MSLLTNGDLAPMTVNIFVSNPKLSTPITLPLRVGIDPNLMCSVLVILSGRQYNFFLKVIFEQPLSKRPSMYEKGQQNRANANCKMFCANY